MTISESRFNVLLAAQTNVAKKVFEAVPIAEAWPARQVYSAMMRNTRASMEYRVLEGCLDSLKDAGLIAEPMRGLWQRITPKEAAERINKVPTMQTKRAETQTDRPIASAAMLTELADRARALASDLDAAATVITEENARNEEGARKYEQFRELMKNI